VTIYDIGRIQIVINTPPTPTHFLLNYAKKEFKLFIICIILVYETDIAS